MGIARWNHTVSFKFVKPVGTLDIIDDRFVRKSPRFYLKQIAVKEIQNIIFEFNV